MSLTTAFYAGQSIAGRRTIKAHNEQGHEVPFLNFYDGVGPRVPDPVVNALADGVASILNGKKSIARVVIPDERVTWNEVHSEAEAMPASLAIRFTFDHDGERSTLYMRPTDSSAQLDERIRNLLIGENRDGLKSALDLLVPQHKVGAKPAVTGPQTPHV